LFKFTSFKVCCYANRIKPMQNPDLTPSQPTAYDQALVAIENCRRTNHAFLSLSDSGLNKLPPEIGQLKWLRQLHLSNTQLNTLPPEIGQLKALTQLHLTHNQLSHLPPELGQFTALTQLYLASNKLSELPPEIGQLTALTLLHSVANQLNSLVPEIGQLKALTLLILHGNCLGSLPPEIGQLEALTSLVLSSNQLSSLPPEIGQLKALTSLALGSNQLGSLPPEIGQLTSLEHLHLGDNQLSILPPEIGQLKALTSLGLSSNQLDYLPPEIGQLKALTQLDLSHNQLSSLPDWLKDLPKLDRLFLHNNPALKLSPSVLGPDPRKTHEGWVTAKSILDFYFGKKLGQTRPLNEVKLILVGRGGAGKTSTVQALQGQPFDEGEESTPGIALCDWRMVGCKKGPVTAHVWDFAGQVITHALHQFFFSVRSVYVVVLTGRENNERDDAEYWLRLIKAFGTDEQGNGPPVIVALNKWDKLGCRPQVDRGALQERYPFIRGFVEVDCKTQKGVSKLNAALCREVDRLPWVREPFPAAWDAVRRALNTGRKKRAHLTYAEYRALCAKHGVQDAGQQDSLAEILHNLGAALNYRNDSRLREATVLQPEWLTKNVYALVRRAEKKAGVLTQADVDAVLRTEKDAAMRAYLLQIMERFEIAYAPRASDEGGGLWLVPQALPDKQPKGVSAFRDALDATRLRYSYQALPEGLVARAIVRLHEFIEEVNSSKQQWASGVILSREGARALIRTEAQDRQVMVTVTGPVKARQQLAGLCQAEMRGIHAEIRGLDPSEETQVQGTWVATATLEADEQKNQQTGIATRDQGTLMVDPAEPNNAYSEKLARRDEVWKPTVFISYSKSNVNQRKRLELELKILKNEGLLAGLWHDRMIDPGDDWNDTIQRELTEADVVIILTSSAALATEYITQHEIPKALELHKSHKTVVVPVILEACRWSSTALSTLNALPEKGQALNIWNPRSAGWHSVANGLAKVFEKLMKKGGANKPHGLAFSLQLKEAQIHSPEFAKRTLGKSAFRIKSSP
jgi:internalin A